MCWVWIGATTKPPGSPSGWVLPSVTHVFWPASSSGLTISSFSPGGVHHQRKQHPQKTSPPSRHPPTIRSDLIRQNIISLPLFLLSYPVAVHPQHVVVGQPLQKIDAPRSRASLGRRHSSATAEQQQQAAASTVAAAAAAARVFHLNSLMYVHMMRQHVLSRNLAGSVGMLSLRQG